MSIEKHLTVDEVAEITRAPRASVLAWIYGGKLSAAKVGRRRLVRESELRRFLGASADVSPKTPIVTAQQRVSK